MLNEIKEKFSYYFFAIERMIVSEFKIRHYQKILGQLWWVLEPLMLAYVFYFLTIVMFRYKGMTEHLHFIFFAVVIWRWFSKTLENSTTFITSSAGIIKQTNFPLFIIALSPLVFEVINFLIALLVTIVVTSFLGNTISWHIIYFPILFIEQLLLTMSISFLLAIFGIYIKDLRHIVTFIVSIWFYVSPGIYPASMIPEKYLYIFKLNPFYLLFVDYKNIFVLHKSFDLMPHFLNIFIYSLFLIFSIFVFNKLSKNIYKYL